MGLVFRSLDSTNRYETTSRARYADAGMMPKSIRFPSLRTVPPGLATMIGSFGSLATEVLPRDE